MVSLWPWKTRDSSPASFEKALAALATRIARTQARLDHTRAAFRRVRLLATLYLGFAYVVYAVVVLLVVGRRGMGPWEWTGLAGGPVLVSVVRRLLAAVYTYRIDARAAHLRDLQAERAQTIQRLKDATRYESTQQLLEKYGGVAPVEEEGEGSVKGSLKGPSPGPGRTNRPPPPTANLPTNLPPTANVPREHVPREHVPREHHQHPQHPHPSPTPSLGVDGNDDAEFAPNAYEPGEAPVRRSPAAAPPPPPLVAAARSVSAPPPPPPAATHWYDRVMDLLLGEDETATKNRIVLLCGHCRLVNGQAPPGTRSLAEVGAWRCMGCGGMNGGDGGVGGDAEVKEVKADTESKADKERL